MGLQSSRKKYDVIVLGAGITGLSTAYHLYRSGIRKIALLHHAGAAAASVATPGLLLAGQIDNFTRYAHAHGPATAAKLWELGHAALDALAAFAQAHALALRRGNHLRLLVSPSEVSEGEKAVSELKAAGFASELYHPPWPNELLPYALGPRILAVQADGCSAGAIDPPALLAALAGATPCSRYRLPVLDLAPTEDRFRVELAGGLSLYGEMVVLACHTETRRFIPSLSEAIIPYVDQWLSVDLGKTGKALPTGAFCANHSNEWGLIAEDQLIWGGGRYLRPLAGIGESKPQLDARVSGHLEELVSKTFPWLDAKEGRRSERSLVDVRPCDELPLIGPMFGEGRLLVATGYMGAGLAMGFMAGRCLAELIRTGACPTLPRLLWPERLRSLAGGGVSP